MCRSTYECACTNACVVIASCQVIQSIWVLGIARRRQPHYEEILSVSWSPEAEVPVFHDVGGDWVEYQ